MSQMIPFGSGAQLPAYLKNRAALSERNADVVTAAAYPTLSIKGKTFAVVRDGKRSVVMRPDDDETPASYVEVSVLRANMKARVFYMKKYDEADGEAKTPPDCMSMDGVAPLPGVPNKQSDACATCPHSVWGTGNAEKGTGRACSDTPRLAIARADALDDAFLLRVPPASIKNWKDAVKIAKERQIPYNALIYRMSFDIDAATPLLKFKPVGLLDDAGFAKADELYDGELVRAIVGIDVPASAAPAPAPAPAPAVDADELDAALAARAAVNQAKAAAKPAAPAPAAKPTVTPDELDTIVPPAPAPAPKPKPKPAPVEAAPGPAPAAKPAVDDDLLEGLDDLLKNSDD